MRGAAISVLLLAGAAALAVVLGGRGGKTPKPRSSRPEAASDPAVAAVAGRAGVRRPLPAAAPRPAHSPVAGRVLGPSGDPEGGVEVTLSRVVAPWPDLQTQPLETLHTADDGSFSFRTPRGPNLMLELRKPGLATERLDAPRRAPAITVRMRHGFSLRGVVRHTFLGPVRGCDVYLEPGPGATFRALHTRTDRTGRFVFRDVRAGVVRLTARHPRFRPAVQPSVNVGSPELVTLTFGRRGLRLTGRVVQAGAEESGIQGAVVRAFPSAPERRLLVPFEHRTDERGAFVIDGLGPGVVQLEVRHPDFSTLRRSVLVGRSTTPQRFELVPRTRVRGRLSGTVVPSGTALLLYQEGERVIETTVEEGGTFAFAARVSAGPAELELADDTLCFARTAVPRIDVQIAESEESVLDLAVAPAAVVEGVVRDESGAPLAGVAVLRRDLTAGPWSPTEVLAVTGPDGRFEVRGLSTAWSFLAAATSELVFRREGYGKVRRTVPGPPPGTRRTLEPVVMTRAARIEGRVRRGGRPLPGALVTAAAGLSSSFEPEITDAEGRYALRDLAPGTYRVRAKYATLPILVHDELVTLGPGDVVGEVDLDYPEGRVVEGRVVDPRGDPVPGALVLVRGAIGAGTVAGGDGRFSLEAPAEAFELQVFESRSELRVEQRVRVGPDQTRLDPIVLPLVPCGVVTARVSGLPGRRPQTRGILRIRPLDGEESDPVRARQRRVQSRGVEMSVGELLLDGFPAGRSEMILQCEGYAPFCKEVVVRPGETVDLGEILLDRGAAVRGVVRDVRGRPVPGARVHVGEELDLLHLDVQGEAGSVTDAAGRFEVFGVSALARRLVVAANGFAPAVVDVRIPADLFREDPLPVVLRSGVKLSVAVRRGETGGAVDQAIVVLEKHGEPMYSAYTRDDGRVEFAALAPGDYEIVVLGQAETRRRIHLDGARDRVEVDLRLR